MPLVKLSSKGQLVLPKKIRDLLGLHPGTILKVECRDRKILLEPVMPSLIDRLYGKFAGEAFLTELETEHRQELGHDDRA